MGGVSKSKFKSMQLNLNSWFAVFDSVLDFSQIIQYLMK
jgi:hypothetical protein